MLHIFSFTVTLVAGTTTALSLTAVFLHLFFTGKVVIMNRAFFFIPYL